MKKVIAIDGPSGAGKSTIAKLIARELGAQYLDTGALYRAVALSLLQCGITEASENQILISALKKTKAEFRGSKLLLNGKDVSEEIRSPEASHYASVFSAKKPVREHLMKIQRDASFYSDLVAEGRDMTTVVFPNAYKKFYLDASVEERAKRRGLELISKGYKIDKEKIRLDIRERDSRDSSREIAPLKKAADAHFIDSTGHSIENVLKKMLDIIKN